MACQEKSFQLLCEDLVVNILSRVPEKDLIRCKCVSKEWHRIISHICVPRLFVEAPVSGLYFRVAKVSGELMSVLTNSPEDVKCRVLHLVAHSDDIHSVKSAPLKALPYPYTNNHSDDGPCFGGKSYASLLPFKPQGPDFLDCCNGLMLFVQRPRPQFYVCNPAIKECVPIPRPCPSVHLPSLYASLAFDPSESIHFRVIILSLTSQPQSMHVFYSQTGEWMTHKVQVEPPDSAQCYQLVRHSVYLKDVLYRLSALNKILRFDLKSLKADILNCPNREISDGQGCIGVLKGCFSYAQREDGWLRVWLLNNSHEPGQWNLKYEIPFQFVVKQVSEQHLYQFLVWLQPYGFHPKSDILFIGSARSLFMFHLENRKVEIVHRNATYNMHGGRFFSIFTYTHTLVTLKNWCSNTPSDINSCDLEVHDNWCYTEQ